MYLHEVIARGLQACGVDHLFGLIGDANLFIVNSYRGLDGTAYHGVAHEATAVLAAIGYAKVAGRPGVATVTHGPAVTNVVTALVEGVKSRTPIVVIVGETDVRDRQHLQAFPQREIVVASGAGFEQVRSPDTAVDDLREAFRRAVSEQRPVVLSLPAHYQWADISCPPLTPPNLAAQRPAPDAEVIDQAAGLLASADRPIVLAGRGAMHARESLIALAEAIGAPMATTLQGRDLFRGHPHDIGVFGVSSHPAALEVIAASDCVVAFGASLNQWTTDGGKLLSGKRIIHVDVADRSINRFTAVDVAVRADAESTATVLREMLTAAGLGASRFASDAVVGRPQQRVPDASTNTVETPGVVDIRQALTLLDRKFPAERTLVEDGGRFLFSVFKYLHVSHPSGYVHTINFGSIGLGIGHAIGAYFAAPDRPVLLVAGDGGFMLSGLSEFNSAVRNKVDLVVVIINDSSYGAEHIQFRDKGMEPDLAVIDWPDLAGVAGSLGGIGFTARSLSEFDSALDHIADRDRPVLIDVKVDPDRVPIADA